MGCKPKTKTKTKISFIDENISKLSKLETTNGGSASGSSQPMRNLATTRQTAKTAKTYKHTNTVTGTFPMGSVTPSKRKTIDGGGEGGEVKSLICIFENDITKPTWQDISVTESPAKRQRCGRQGSK